MPPARKMTYALRLQLIILSATWLAGIYVNGFVPIIPGTTTQADLLIPAVGLHVILATLAAAAAVFILALTWVAGSRITIATSLLASLSIVVAGDSGLGFVLGGGSDPGESMIMASAFVTAIYLTFLTLAGTGIDAGEPKPGSLVERRLTDKAPLILCILALLLFYGVFITGMYVNLFVAGPVFSLPLNSEPAAFLLAERSAAFLVHEALGGALLVVLVLLTGSLSFGRGRKLSIVSAVPMLLVAFSAYVGSLNLTPSLLLLPASPVLPMLSAGGLVASIVVTMLLTLRLRAGRPGS